MALTLATNIASINTQKWLGVSGAGQSRALEQLSSGSKINKAADDAAGSAISTKLNVKAVSLGKAIDNGNQSIAMLQTAESGMSTIADILTRLKELATEAASDNNSTDIGKLDAERLTLTLEITKISQNTKYGSTSLLNGDTPDVTYGTAADGIAVVQANSNAGIGGTYAITTTANANNAAHFDIAVAWTDAGGKVTTQTVTDVSVPSTGNTSVIAFDQLGISLTTTSALAADTGAFTVAAGAGATTTFDFQVGDTNQTYDRITVTISGLSLTGLGLNTGDIASKANAQAYLGLVDMAIETVDTSRANIGAAQNQINYHMSNLQNTLQNTQAATSTIRDTDYAKSMSEFTKFQVMTQAGVAMLAQSNQLPQQILSLLKG